MAICWREDEDLRGLVDDCVVTVLDGESTSSDWWPWLRFEGSLTTDNTLVSESELVPSSEVDGETFFLPFLVFLLGVREDVDDDFRPRLLELVSSSDSDPERRRLRLDSDTDKQEERAPIKS